MHLGQRVVLKGVLVKDNPSSWVVDVDGGGTVAVMEWAIEPEAGVEEEK